MRHASGVATLALAVLTCATGAAVAAQVKTDYDHAVDFAPIKTFSITIGTGWGNEISEKRVLGEVAKTIAGKGWAQADEEGADVRILLHGATDTKRSLDTFYTGWGGYGYGGWAGGMGTATTTEHVYTIGTLVIDIFDGTSKALIWRGTASDYLSSKTEKNQKTLQSALTKLFKNFPPSPAKKK